ncbi:protein of unknown function [Kyrpidia spormannii]|uniref:Uncharacterized protein n=1 Tax=Kyrpidia spormannii TaxID=2055160 RepID=A0A6F9EGW2_9BACL|nr:protein of unknown function [Kyrpidia spormannii]
MTAAGILGPPVPMKVVGLGGYG